MLEHGHVVWCEAVGAPHRTSCIHDLSVTDHDTKYRIQVTQGSSGDTYTLPYMVIACCVCVRVLSFLGLAEFLVHHGAELSEDPVLLLGTLIVAQIGQSSSAHTHTHTHTHRAQFNDTHSHHLPPPPEALPWVV